MDVLKVIARNALYKALAPFKGSSSAIWNKLTKVSRRCPTDRSDA